MKFLFNTPSMLLLVFLTTAESSQLRGVSIKKDSRELQKKSMNKGPAWQFPDMEPDRVVVGTGNTGPVLINGQPSPGGSTGTGNGLSGTSNGSGNAMESNIPASIAGVVAGMPPVSRFYRFMLTGGLDTTLGSPGSYTLFAADNTAFAVGTSAVNEAVGTLPALQNTLHYHVVPGLFRSRDLIPGMQLTTLQGSTLIVGMAADGESIVNGVTVIDSDIPASNGIVHVVSQLLIPV